MKTKESIYITPFGKFLTKMWNEIKCEWEYIGTFDDEKTAKKKLGLHQIEHYKDKRYLLPKCISLNLTRNRFTFVFFYNNKNIFTKDFTTLEEAIQEKQNLLLKLL